MDLTTGDIAMPAESYSGSLRLSRAAALVQADAHDLVPIIDESIPDDFSLLGEMPAAEDQSHRGTCATFAVSAAAGFHLAQNVSEQHLYNLAWHRHQRDDGPDPHDEGTSIEAVLKELADRGACAEVIWDYVPTPIAGNLPQDPVPQRALNANKIAITGWEAIAVPARKRGEHVAQQIFSRRAPVILALPVVWGSCGWEFGFLIARPSGSLPAPNHAVVAVGYNLKDRFLIIQNSWGADWGLAGFGLVSFDFLEACVPEMFVVNGVRP